jgi:DNA mismatch repair protein MutS2
MIEYSFRVLEYYRLIEILSEYAASPLGRFHCLSLRPLKELDAIQAEQKLTSEMKELLLVKGFVPLSDLSDLRPALAKADKKGGCLEPAELLSIYSLLKTSRRAKAWIRGQRDLCPCLAVIVDEIPDTSDLSKEIERSITEDGGVSDRASPLLASLRSQRAALRRALEKRLGAIIERLEFREESLISIRDGRYVVSVRSDKKSSLQGIIHGYSKTHSTCFTEPLTVVEENNRLVEINEREKEEERRVLEWLTGLVHESSAETLACLEIMGRIDCLFAKAEFSRAVNGISPILSSEKVIYLSDASNPILLSLYLKSKKGSTGANAEEVVPISIRLDDETGILIISGPNRGGKTVALKTIGLLALMTQAGIHIPAAEGTRMGVFQNVLAEIGDEQDIGTGLSTFSARVEHFKEIVGAANENSLVILDELGTGTDPDEGTALAMAILDYLSDRGSLTAISTHYHKLKRYGLINKRAQNASVEFDYERSKPNFRLLTGVPGVSHAIEIARDSGLNDEIIDKAVGYLGQDKGKPDLIMEELTQMLEEVRREKESIAVAKEEYLVAKNRAEQERSLLGEQLNYVLAEKNKEIERALGEAKKEFGKAIELIKEKGSTVQTEATQRYLKARGDLGDAMVALRESHGSGSKAPLFVGQTVYHNELKKTGVVLGVDETVSRARIAVGNMKLTVDSSLLTPEPRTPVSSEKGMERGKAWSVSASLMDQKDLNLIGYSVADALPLLDRMIDQAVVQGHTRLKVIHGVGSGTLRRAIREHLGQSIYVKDFSPESAERANDAVTIVEL